MDVNFLIISLVAIFLAYRIVMYVLKSGEKDDAPTESPVSETELLREVHQGLARMEKRIEALETLLAERDEVERATAHEKRP